MVLSHDRIVDAIWDGRVVSDEPCGERSSACARRLPAVAPKQHPHHSQEGLCRHLSGVGSRRGRRRNVAGTAAATGPLAIAVAVALFALGAVLLARMDVFPEHANCRPYRDPGRCSHHDCGPAVCQLQEDSDSEFLADGLAEELLSTLARNPICASRPAIRPSGSRGKAAMCAISGGNWAWATCWKAACAGRSRECG